MASTVGQTSDRKSGTVTRVLGDYGFISCEGLPEQDLYFKAAWFRSSPPLQEGEKVTFQVRTFGTAVQAHYLNREADNVPQAVPSAKPASRVPTTGYLFDWAYLGYLPNVLAELKGLALQEDWEFKDTPPSAVYPFPILHSYLIQTFGRLVMEGKVLVNEKASVAAFNTGVVDRRYEPIHALFASQDDPRAAWQLDGLCIAGEGADGQNLVRHFAPLPSPAHYFDDQMDLLYDARKGKPELDWQHVIIARIDRYPAEYFARKVQRWTPESTASANF